MLKNASIKQVIILLTVFITSLNLLILFFLTFTGKLQELSLGVWLAILTFFLLVSFFSIQFVVEKYVFSKIKLIYKLINTSKRSHSDEDSQQFLQRNLNTVNEDVLEWAQEKQEEIAYLTKLENYRRNFLGNISHELKTPIFSIQGYVQTLLEGALYDEKVNIKYLRRASSNLDRLEGIVEDLETINNLEAGNIKINIKKFKLGDLAREVMDDFQIIADKRSIKISFKEKTSAEFMVWADENRIRQVFNNLITNSIKYGKESGKIVIGIYDMIQHVLIEVSDDGEGIEESHLRHLFDRFYRVDSDRGRRTGGSGLGLAIVKHIVEAHEGTVSVKSTVGEGTTFAFTLMKKNPYEGSKSK